MNVINKILQMIKQVICTASNNDSDMYPRNQINALRKTSEANRLSVYGICYNPPINTFGLSFSSQGKESTKFVLFDNPKDRLKLKPGEIALYNYTTESYVKCDTDGNINIISKNNVNITTDGDLNINADNVNINANSVNHDGVKIDKDHKHGPGNYATSQGPIVQGCSGDADSCIV